MRAVTTAASPPVPAGATAVCRVEDIPFGEGRRVIVEGRRIGIFNTPSGFFAIDNDCPHEGGPLSDGIVADACVTCPLHGRRVDLATGRVLGRDESVRTYALTEADGVLWLQVEPASAPEHG